MRYRINSTRLLTVNATAYIVNAAFLRTLIHHNNEMIKQLIEWYCKVFVFFFQAEDGIRDYKVTGVQTCALPISGPRTTSMRSTLSVVSAAKSYVPPGSFAGTPSTSTFTYLLSPPRRKRDVVAPGEIGRASCRERV